MAHSEREIVAAYDWSFPIRGFAGTPTSDPRYRQAVAASFAATARRLADEGATRAAIAYQGYAAEAHEVLVSQQKEHV